MSKHVKDTYVTAKKDILLSNSTHVIKKGERVKVEGPAYKYDDKFIGHVNGISFFNLNDDDFE